MDMIPLSQGLCDLTATMAEACAHGRFLASAETLQHLQLLTMQARLIEAELAYWRQEIPAAELNARTNALLIEQSELLRDLQPGGLN